MLPWWLWLVVVAIFQKHGNCRSKWLSVGWKILHQFRKLLEKFCKSWSRLVLNWYIFYNNLQIMPVLFISFLSFSVVLKSVRIQVSINFDFSLNFCNGALPKSICVKGKWAITKIIFLPKWKCWCQHSPDILVTRKICKITYTYICQRFQLIYKFLNDLWSFVYIFCINSMKMFKQQFRT